MPVHTDSVSVLFTTEEETLAAAAVAAPLATAMAVPLTVIQFRTAPYPLFADAFKQRLQAQGVDARVRVYLCRNSASVIPMAFRGHSLIVLGGRRRWWPTAAERWRRRLEAAGHLVLFVDVRERRRSGQLEASCA